MAVQPNYYFNSPYIADAARNLAAALAPPDKAKQVQEQRAAWLFQHEQDKAKLEEQLRTETDLGRSYLADLEGLQPVLNDKGDLDEAATEAASRQLQQNAIKYHMDPKAVDRAAGPYGQTFITSMALAKARADATSERDRQLFGYRGQLQRSQQDFTRELTTTKLDHASMMQDKRYAYEWQQRQAALEQRQRERAAGGQTLAVVGKPLEDLMVLADQRFDNSGLEYTQQDYDDFLDLASEYLQTTRRAESAINLAWKYGVEPNLKKKTERPAPKTVMEAWIQKMQPDETGKLVFRRPDSVNFSDAIPGAGAGAPNEFNPNPPPAPGAPPPRKSAPSRAAPTGKVAQPKNKAEYDALKPGTHFIDPTGTERIKP